jgi:hypothetical protein
LTGQSTQLDGQIIGIRKQCVKLCIYPEGHVAIHELLSKKYPESHSKQVVAEQL